MLTVLMKMPALILAGLCLSPVAAGAAGGDEDAQIRRGLELRRAGHDEAAQLELQQTYDQDPSPRAAAQLGFVEQALGQWARAKEHVDEALQTPDDPWIRRNRPIIEGARDTIAAHLTRRRPLAAVVPPAFAPGLEGGASPVLATAASPPSEPGRTRVMIGAALSGVGIGALLGGVALSLTRDSSATIGVTMSPATAPGMVMMPPPVPPDPKKKNDLSLAAAPSAAPSSHAWAADALYVVGGAALLTGGVLLVSGRRSEREGRAVQTVSLRPLLAPGGVGAAVNLGF
jgi:hypothetical protein